MDSPSAIRVLANAILLSTYIFAQKPSLAILDLDGIGISQSEAIALSNRLRNEIFSLGRARVVERGMMQSILEEQEFQELICNTDECMVTVGQLLGAEQIVGGSVSKIADYYTVSVRMINVETGEVIRVADVDVKGALGELLTSGMQEIALKITGTLPTQRPVVQEIPIPSVQTVPRSIPSSPERIKPEKTIPVTHVKNAHQFLIGFTRKYMSHWNEVPNSYFAIEIMKFAANYWESTSEPRVFLIPGISLGWHYRFHKWADEGYDYIHVRGSGYNDTGERAIYEHRVYTQVGAKAGIKVANIGLALMPGIGIGYGKYVEGENITRYDEIVMKDYDKSDGSRYADPKLWQPVYTLTSELFIGELDGGWAVSYRIFYTPIFGQSRELAFSFYY